MKHKVAWIVGAVVALVVIVILIIPLFINANDFRPRIESAASTSLNRKVQIGNLRLSIFSGAVNADSISIADDTAFSNGPFLSAKSLKVGVKLLPLIFSKQVNVTAFTIEQPEVLLLKNAKGDWNYSTLGTTGSTQSSTSTSNDSSTNISVDKLEISNGKLLVGKVGDSKRHEYDNVDLKASDLSYSTQFPFTFTAQTPGNGTVGLDGKMGPLNRTDMQQTPLDAKLDVKNFDLASTGFVDPSAGLAGVVDFSASLMSDGHNVDSNGTLTARNLRVMPGSGTANVPVTVNYEVKYDPASQMGTVSRGDVQLGKAVAHLTGTFNTSGEVVSVQMKLNGQNMPAADLQGVLPAVGVTLPKDASIQSGAMNADLTITGPVDKLVTTGPVNLSNAKLANFNLGSKLGPIAHLTGLPSASDTTIQTFSSNLRVAPEGIRADNLDLIVAGIGTLTGNGTISPSNALDFKMAAKFGGGSSSGGQVASAESLLGGGQQGGGIPFLIQGTTSDPKFVPNLKGMVKSLVPSKAGQLPGAAQGLLGGILGKKKQ